MSGNDEGRPRRSGPDVGENVTESVAPHADLWREQRYWRREAIRARSRAKARARARRGRRQT